MVSSLAAQGLWMRMLCVAAAADPIGYVLIAGRPVTATDLALLTGAPEAQIDELWKELDHNGVFSRDRHGRIYNRRMVRDAKKQRDAKRFGKKGGNPALLTSNGKDEEKPPTLKGGLNGGVAPRSQDQKQDQRVPRERITSVLSSAARGSTEFSPADKKLKWMDKIYRAHCQREPDRADTVLEAFRRGEKWAKDIYNRIDSELRGSA